ncbi:hypothetical protein P5E74_14330, partial [Clostridium perfringens]|nr:hypothetical protein [Clostridium perfringens]
RLKLVKTVQRTIEHGQKRRKISQITRELLRDAKYIYEPFYDLTSKNGNGLNTIRERASFQATDCSGRTKLCIFRISGGRL